MSRNQTKVTIVVLYIAAIFSFSNLSRDPLFGPILFIVAVQCIGWAGILVGSLLKAKQP